MPTESSFRKLKSRRLIIDCLTASDADAFYRYRSMPEVTQFQDWAPQSIDDAEDYISRAAKVSFDQPGTWFQLALRDSTSGDLVGDIGLHFLDDGGDQVEIGFTVSPARQNKGLATEALQTVLEYLFADLNKHRVVASVDPRNHASCHLLQKIGFRMEGHFKESLLVNGDWVDDARFGMLRSEWV